MIKFRKLRKDAWVLDDFDRVQTKVDREVRRRFLRRLIFPEPKGKAERAKK